MARVGSSYLETRTEGDPYAVLDLSARRDTCAGETAVPTDSTTAVRLIQQVANRDRNAFSQLYDRFSTLVFTLAMRMLKARSVAEDLFQEVFLQVWRQAPGYSAERGSPEAWIINIARSQAIDKIRSIRRMGRSFLPTDDAALAGSGENVESLVVKSQARMAMNSALANLPEAQRKVLELAYLDGLTQTEIAERLAEPLGMVKTRMRSGIQRLREIVSSRVA
ncbi:MAG TPA: sigma-70 family RNA polymerase sigma factor [Candidatus Binatia bacterium]